MEWAMADRTKDVLSASDAVMEGDEDRIRASRRGIPARLRARQRTVEEPLRPSDTYESLAMLKPPGLCRPRRRIKMAEFRVEKDFLGEVKGPKDAYWGVQTQRAIENFPISGIRFGRRFIYALGLIKMAGAPTNIELGFVGNKNGNAIVQTGQDGLE